MKDRERESRPNSPTSEGYGTGSSFAYHKVGASASERISSSKANKSNTQHHREKQFSTLKHIDDILDNLNFNSREMADERRGHSQGQIQVQGGDGSYRGEEESTFKGRQGQRKGNNSSTGINNLIQMVDEVVSKLS